MINFEVSTLLLGLIANVLQEIGCRKLEKTIVPGAISFLLKWTVEFDIDKNVSYWCVVLN